MPAVKELLKMSVDERSRLKWNDPRILDVASKIAIKHDIPPSLMLAILYSENSYFDKKTKQLSYSNNDSHTVSSALARGLMQITDNTREKLKDGLFKHNVLDPIENLAAAARYLQVTLKQYKGNVAAVIADYNGGPPQAAYVMKGKLPENPETKEYVLKSMESLRVMKLPEVATSPQKPEGNTKVAAAPVEASPTTNSATPLEIAVESQFGLKPNQDRLSILPKYDKKEGWIAPDMVYNAASAIAAPAVALEGNPLGTEEAFNVASFGLRGAPKMSKVDLKGLKQAVENNKYVYKSQDTDFLSGSYGRHVGYPSPKGTPAEKLFSNFADTPADKKPEVFNYFRGKMLERANNYPDANNKYSKETIVPFLPGFTARIDAHSTKGNTRVQILQGDKLVAAARMDRGILDSIAVDEKFKGKDVGFNLLKFLDENRIANVWEVPDRSPGFVSMQKRLIEEKLNNKGIDSAKER
jgi:SLT domain-containing protein